MDVVNFSKPNNQIIKQLHNKTLIEQLTNIYDIFIIKCTDCNNINIRKTCCHL